MIHSIDEIITISRQHPNETIREIIRYDSGYLKDLFIKNHKLVFSPECLSDIQKLTKGHRDNWEKPTRETPIIFKQFKPYSRPYLYDFNDEQIEMINNTRLEQYIF